MGIFWGFRAWGSLRDSGTCFRDSTATEFQVRCDAQVALRYWAEKVRIRDPDSKCLTFPKAIMGLPEISVAPWFESPYSEDYGMFCFGSIFGPISRTLFIPPSVMCKLSDLD